MPNGWQRLPSSTAIQPIIIGSNADVLKAAAALQAQGLWMTAIRAPTVPVGTARLRITLSAAHTVADVVQLTKVLGSLS
jgi:8-amino-7-oxononanoate synthase